MRIRPSWSHSRILHSRLLTRRPISLHNNCTAFLPHLSSLRHAKRPFFAGAGPGRADRSTLPTPALVSEQQQGSAEEEENTSKTSARARRQSKCTLYGTQDSVSDTWMHELEPLLPLRLRLFGADDARSANRSVTAVLAILHKSRIDVQTSFKGSCNLLTYMVTKHGRHDAALYLVNQLLHFAASGKDYLRQDILPSNLHWSATSLNDYRYPVNASILPKSSLTTPLRLEERYGALPPARGENAALAHVWGFLGDLVIKSADSSTETSQALLTTVHRVLAKMHHLNLIPQNVYSYDPTSHSTTIQRPPILHLLSSRILTTLSDAVWRSIQDEAISEAANSGMSYQQIGQDPPGGRFWLKVRDLGPAAWLEFILWCCIGGGFERTGAHIVEMARTQTNDPWLAVSWTSNSKPQDHTQIDWDRVKMRSGGTVGRIEGYSSDNPLVEIPPRTISVEVILALVEGLLSDRPLKQSGQRHVWRIIRWICHLIKFLEPHTLPPEYFDYLTVRMLQNDALDLTQPSELLQAWVGAMGWMRSLESTRKPPPGRMDLSYRTVLDYNEIQAGVLHQVLQGFLCAGLPIEAVEVFNQIQELVDGSKVQAISSFITSPPTSSAGFFDARTVRGDPDFVASHGQLPLHRVAGFLNMVTANSLVGLGEWMLYSQDVDGPIIPRKAFRKPSMAAALARYAGESNDTTILDSILHDQRAWRMKPGVKYLRSMVNAHVANFDIHSARELLTDLVLEEAGGYSPDNLAHLAGAVLRLESRPPQAQSLAVVDKLEEVKSLIRDILDGQFNGNRGSFYRTQITLFRQQIGHLLRIFDNLPSASLDDIAFVYKPQYPSGNAANLQPETFNILLTVIVASKGAAEGRRMWELFCKAPALASNRDLPPDSRDYYVPDPEASYEDDSETEVTVGHPGLVSVETASQSGPVLTDREISGVYLSQAHEPKVLSEDGDVDSTPVPTSDISLEADIPASSSRSTGLLSSHVLPETGVNPVVVPRITTLRIIARGALLQQQDKRLFQGLGETGSVLLWAKDLLRAFGRSNSAIKRELRLPMAAKDLGVDRLMEESSREPWQPFAREREEINVRRPFTGSPLPRQPGQPLKGNSLNNASPTPIARAQPCRNASTE